MWFKFTDLDQISEFVQSYQIWFQIFGGHSCVCQLVNPDPITWLFKCYTKMHGINLFDGSSVSTEHIVFTHLISNSTNSAS
jgi:hypothetical protein